MRKDITTIKISKSVARSLNELKVHPRQSYEEIILELITKKYSAKKVPTIPLFAKIRDPTTIKLNRKTAELLNKMKIHPRQPYNEIISRIASEK